jgi:bacterioferritin-associated ferredoxin
MWVCLCEGVTSRIICDAIDSGARTVKEIAKTTRAGTDCNKCTRTIRVLIAQLRWAVRCGRRRWRPATASTIVG